MPEKPQYRLNNQGQLERIPLVRTPLLWLLLLALGVSVGALLYHWQGYDLMPQPAAQKVVPELDWEQLLLLDYETNKAPETLTQWLGKRVKIAGFIVPLDARDNALTEFLLVPVYGMCIHVPPPPPNMMIYVKSEAGVEAADWMMDGVWLEGELQIQKVNSDYGAAGFVMHSVQLYPVKFAAEPTENTSDPSGSPL